MYTIWLHFGHIVFEDFAKKNLWTLEEHCKNMMKVLSDHLFEMFAGELCRIAHMHVVISEHGFGLFHCQTTIKLLHANHREGNIANEPSQPKNCLIDANLNHPAGSVETSPSTLTAWKYPDGTMAGPQKQRIAGTYSPASVLSIKFGDLHHLHWMHGQFCPFAAPVPCNSR